MMMHRTILRSSNASSLATLFRQLHINQGAGRLDVTEKLAPFIAVHPPSGSKYLLFHNYESRKGDKSCERNPTLAPLLAQARQAIVENPFQYSIRPSIGIPPEILQRPEYRTPVSPSVNIPLDTPANQNSQNKEIRDNPVAGAAEEKQAARLVVIRRIKMNKHKLKKLYKKMKYVYAKVRQRRAIRKEKAFLNEKMDLIKAARAFDAKEYVAGIIKKAKEEPIPYKWQDPLMPEWFKEQEMKKEAWQQRYQKMINVYLNKSITIDFRDKKK